MRAGAPSRHGVSPSGISTFLDAIELDPRIEPHGLIIQRHGRRVAEGYWRPHTSERSRLVYSLSKSFTGTALGLQLGEGRLTLDDLVSDHLPELFADAAPGALELRIRHIASMSTGHDRETFGEAIALDPIDPVRGFLQIPTDAEPGTLFAYNQPPVLALTTILQGLCGERLRDYLRPRLLDPLGIDSFEWVPARPGLDMGFSGVHTNLDAVARLGQLHLDDGLWAGERVLPDGWVAQASTVQVENPEREEPDWQQGYGFQLWMSRHGYRGDGAFGQYMVVLPEHDAVIAMFSSTEEMQVVLDLMWQHLLPAMSDDLAPAGPSPDDLAPDDLAPDDLAPDDLALAGRLARLELPTATRRTGGRPPTVVTPTRFTPGPTTSLSHRSITSMEIADNQLTIDEGDHSIRVPVTSEWSTTADGWLAASAATIGHDRIAVDVVFLDTPHRLEIELDLDAAQFSANWPRLPLFGGGIAPALSTMRAPTASSPSGD